MTRAGFRIAILAHCLLTTAYAADGPQRRDAVQGDVRNHGAVCDGRADDTQALIRAGQSALEVYIDPGLTCRVTGPLATAIRPGQRWYGGGAITVDDGFNFTVFSVAGKTDVTFDGLIARSGRLAARYDTADARFIEFISGAHRGRAVNNRITGFQQAVRVHGSTDSVVEGNEVSGAWGWGISVQTGAHRAEVTRNRIAGTVFEHGIYASGSPRDLIRGLQVRDNTVSDSKIDGIKLTYTDGAIVSGNTTSGNGGQGIYVTIGTSLADVRDNLAHSNGDNGILVYDGTTTSSDNRIGHNTVRGNRSHGLVVTSAGAGSVVRTRVVDNEVEGNGGQGGRSGDGVVVSGPATTRETTVEGNRIRRQRIGVNVAGGRDTAVGRNVYDECETSVVEAAAKPSN